MTGYPIIDAGMRELWTTGYMHNRVRMITVLFWLKIFITLAYHGEKWFWDCLFDADYAITLRVGSGLQELEQTLHHISEFLILLLNQKNLTRR